MISTCRPSPSVIIEWRCFRILVRWVLCMHRHLECRGLRQSCLEDIERGTQAAAAGYVAISTRVRVQLYSARERRVAQSGRVGTGSAVECARWWRSLAHEKATFNGSKCTATWGTS